MLEHGGRLRAAAQQYGIPLADWLDLSTGLAPWPFSFPAVPASVCSQIQRDVAAEQSRLQDQVSGFKYYPVANIGVTIGF